MTTHTMQVATSDAAKKEEKRPVKPTASFAGIHAEITDALNFVEFGIAPKAQPPAQRGVLIETGRNRIVFSAHDFDTSVSVTIPAATPLSKGSSLLDFPELKETLAAMVAGETKAVAARTRVSLDGDLLATEHLTVPVTTHDLHEYTKPRSRPPSGPWSDGGIRPHPRPHGRACMNGGRLITLRGVGQ
ncbi:hypothetical protein [Streptomyces sp. BF23-19]|uniref:hypothetical protein n=1 Tax=unclassified Streptomyces TaxID=2593676 RepID=UPI0034E4B38E